VRKKTVFGFVPEDWNVSQLAFLKCVHVHSHQASHSGTETYRNFSSLEHGIILYLDEKERTGM
jgi:hypothetical protein